MEYDSESQPTSLGRYCGSSWTIDDLSVRKACAAQAKRCPTKVYRLFQAVYEYRAVPGETKLV